MTAIVVGAGVIGLSTALRLLEDGWRVTVIAKTFSPSTTSDIAAGFWFPYCAEPLDRVVAWANETLNRFRYFATFESEKTGCEVSSGYILYEHEKHPNGPFWKVFDIPQRKLTDEELPKGMSEGYFITSVVTRTQKHLIYLQERVKALGGTLQSETIKSIYDVVGRADIVCNCTGLEARVLANDSRAFPIRGQVIYLAPNPKSPVKHFYMVEDQLDNITYIYPRSDRIIIGGTANKHAWDTQLDMKVAEGIRKRCGELEPEINNSELHPVIGHAVGLRPGRDQVRLEVEMHNGRPIIHNYGHGGCGWTVSWGTAKECVQLAKPFKPTVSKL